MRSTFKILFYINRQKTKVDGNTAILCRITIDGKSTAITTGEECNPSRWNSKQGLTTDRKTNQRISEFRELVENTYRDILTREGVVSVELTFGTMTLNAGIPIESIAKMMGHASISSTQIYAQITDNKISEDMDRLIAKQSAKEKETAKREASELSENVITHKMEETA